MIIIACVDCRLAIRVIGEVAELDTLVGPDSEYWPDKYPCPRCDKLTQAVFEREMDPSVLSVIELVDCTPHETFIALQGLGLPKERNCTSAQVVELFQTPVRRVFCHDSSGTTRSIVECIEFWDGTRLYLGSSPAGAVVYRIVDPPSHTQEVLGE